MRGMLCLEDGFSVLGELLNYNAETAGEVVFSTGMTGYDAALTDPSYAGQILVFSFPMIGNYGCVNSSGQSPRVAVRGLIARDIWGGVPDDGSTRSLPQLLSDSGCPALHGLDTRSLVLHLREHGSMKGVIAAVHGASSILAEKVRLQEKAKAYDMNKIVEEFACKEEVSAGSPDALRGTCVLMDFGVKSGMIESLLAEGFRVVKVPPTTSAASILAHDPACVLLSNGPGNPCVNTKAVDVVASLLGEVPVFGICLGHQIIGLAAGANITKLRYGHHGGNHPVKNIATGRAFITSQNHNYAVDGSGLPSCIKVTYESLNDGTVEGLEVRGKDGGVLASSLQFHPEGSPGPAYGQFWALRDGGAANA